MFFFLLFIKNIRKYFKEALKYLSLAYVNRYCKILPWCRTLREFWENCLKEATEWLATLDTKGMCAMFNHLHVKKQCVKLECIK